MIDFAQLPTLNAVLNSTTAVLLVLGYLAIRRRNIRRHKILMLSAVGTSILFLISYLTYHYTQLHTVFPGEGWIRTVYYAILFSHIVLAVLMVPMVGLTLFRALQGDFVRHKRIAPYTLFIWLYVSVTGVWVYFMLYVFYPSA